MAIPEPRLTRQTRHQRLHQLQLHLHRHLHHHDRRPHPHRPQLQLLQRLPPHGPHPPRRHPRARGRAADHYRGRLLDRRQLHRPARRHHRSGRHRRRRERRDEGCAGLCRRRREPREGREERRGVGEGARGGRRERGVKWSGARSKGGYRPPWMEKEDMTRTRTLITPHARGIQGDMEK